MRRRHRRHWWRASRPLHKVSGAHEQARGPKVLLQVLIDLGSIIRQVGALAKQTMPTCTTLPQNVFAIRRWRAERLRNLAQNRRSSPGCRRPTTLARGAPSELCSKSTTLSWFPVVDGAERTINGSRSARDRRPSRGFGRSMAPNVL